MVKKRRHQANKWYKTESSILSKLLWINKRKKIVKRAKYVMQLKSSQISWLLKATSRMLNLKTKFKGWIKGEVSHRCDLRIND